MDPRTSLIKCLVTTSNPHSRTLAFHVAVSLITTVVGYLEEGLVVPEAWWMDTGALPMDLEEDMMVTALHSRTLQTVVIHSLSSLLPGTTLVTSGMDISRISSEALGRVDHGEPHEVVEGPQDPTEGCRKWTLSKWINVIHRIMFNRQKHTGQCTIICYQKSYYLFVLPFRKLIVKGLFSSHKDRTAIVSFTLPGYGRKLFLFCMFCPKRHLEPCTQYNTQIPHPCLGVKHYILMGW